MRLCVNHQDRSSTQVCHYCGDECCERCIDEGILYWYCKKSECRQALQKEITLSLPENIVCPDCESQLLLDPNERFEKKLTCSTCEAVLDFNYDPPNISRSDDFELHDLELQDYENPRLLDLFLSPRKFFNKTINAGKTPFLIFIAYIMGIATVADRFELKSAGDPNDLFYYMGDSWLAFWGFSMGLAIIAALFIYGFGGWWYRMRLHLSGVREADKFKARYVYLYSSFVHIAPYILVLVIYTLYYKNYTEAASIDKTLLWMPYIFLLLSLYISYTGATEVFKPKKWRAVLWFIFLPGIFYLFIFGGTALLMQQDPMSDYTSDELIPYDRIITASDSSCQVRLPANWKLLKNINEDAVIQIGNPKDESYCLIISDYKEWTDMDFNEYFEFSSSNMRSMRGSYLKETTTENYNYNAQSIIAYETLEGTHLVYILDVIETEQFYYQLFYWTILVNEQKQVPVFRQISESFREITRKSAY